jgi:uroporphyrinogen-III synthase
MSLRNLEVIITRPLNQARSLQAKVSQHQGNPILIPTLEIVAVEKNTALVKTLDHIEEYEILIFTSQNAVDQVAPLLSPSQNQKIFAMGPSTAAALARYQIPVFAIPVEKYDSEHLLALPIFQQVTGKRLLIVTGEGGRDHLENELVLRGAKVTKLAVYRRQLPEYSEKTLSELIFIKNGIIVTTSCAGLTNIITLLQPKERIRWLRQMPVLVISERMHEFAIDAGLERDLLVMADNATDEAILECLIKWYSNKNMQKQG